METDIFMGCHNVQQRDHAVGADRQDVKTEKMESEKEDVEFWPVEHPMEPGGEDRPVKCPMLTSSVINGPRTSEEKTLPDKTESAAAPTRAVRKRHHTLTGNQFRPIKPVMMPHHPQNSSLTIFHGHQFFELE